MNVALDHICEHSLNWERIIFSGYTNKSNKATLQTIYYMIRNVIPGGLRSSTLLLSHGDIPQYLILRTGWGIFFYIKNTEKKSGKRSSELQCGKEITLK